MKVKRFDSSEGNVWKYVFDFGDAVAEAVLYRYESFMKRTVLCVSVQSGCPVGCKFCGTGKRFIRNLSSSEIVRQVKECLDDFGLSQRVQEMDRFQIMFMSMGEPMLNFNSVQLAIRSLYRLYPDSELLVSTVGIDYNNSLSDLLTVSRQIPNVGLQLSVHEALEYHRNQLIPFKNKLSLRELRDYGMIWNKATGRPVFINYCVHSDNQSDAEIGRLMDLFSPTVFNFTFSVVCSSDENMKDKGYRELDKINHISQRFMEVGYNVRVFDPSGQDDIGGGCGQLWYVQEWMRKIRNFNND